VRREILEAIDALCFDGVAELPALRELPRCPIGRNLRAPYIEQHLVEMERFARRKEECPYHEPPWKDAAAVAIAIWREFTPDTWTRTAAQARVDELTYRLSEAVESLVFEPLRLQSENEDLRQGNHRLCALRFDGAEEVLVELVH